MTLNELVKMFEGQASGKHTLEVSLDDVRLWQAENERLTAERNKWREEANQLEQSHVIVAAENERLRAALEEIAGFKTSPYELLNVAIDIARRALEGRVVTIGGHHDGAGSSCGHP